MNADMRDKIVLVTGATAGIGRVTVLALAKMGARVVAAGRSEVKASAVTNEIRAAGGQADYLLADFSDLAQVRRLAEAFKQRYERLDVLINNAGAYFNRRRLNANGIEHTFLVNHLAPFVLTTALLETLKASQPARIVNVSSGVHVHATLDFDDLSFQRGYFGTKAYARSKLANILFTYELARCLEGTGVTANALHPGLVATDIWRTNFPFIGPAFKWLIGLHGLTPEEGADTIIYLAASPEVEGVTGKYFVRRQAAPSSALSNDEQAARRLWEESERLAHC